MNRKALTAIALVLPLTLGACVSLNDTQQRTLTGGAIGAGVGAVGTAVTGGCVACGAAIGGAVGAAGGYVFDQLEKKN
jgi:osmotically inducible lipoprotein OsmB